MGWVDDRSHFSRMSRPRITRGASSSREIDQRSSDWFRVAETVRYVVSQRLVNKIGEGKGSDDDHKKILETYEAMAQMKPPKGDEASWKMKTETLIAAAKELVEKKPGAAEKFKAASNCKGCHSVHKGK